MHFANKDFYEGEFYLDKMHGKGFLITHDRIYYNANWVDGQKHGNGTWWTENQCKKINAIFID